MARLEVDIAGNLSDLDKSLNQAQSKLQAFASKAQAIGAGLTLALTLPILAVGKASLKAASDAEETFSKFNVVFRDVAKNAEDSFQTLRGEYGLSGLAAKQLLSDTGDLLTGFGFSQTAALDLATQVNKLAVDLASFTNFSGGAEGASNALTKALLGERESVKALGISILEEDVKKQVAINTAKGLIFETERQAKAYATLDIAVAQSQNAIGDYSRTSEGYANQQRLLASRIEDLSVSIGSVFLPVANKLTGVFLRVTETLNSLSSETRQTIVIMAGIAAAIGPALLAIGTAIKLIPILTAGFLGLKTAVIAATGPFGLIAIAIVAAIPLLINLNEELKRTAKIAGEVKADLLTESLKSSREEFERLSKSLESTGLKPLEAQNRAIDLLLKQELDLLNVRGKQNKDIDAIKARVAALNQLKIEINSVTDATGKLTDGLGLIGGLTEQINALNEQRDLAKDQREVNLITAKVTALENQLDLINAIANRASQPIKSEVGVLAPRESPFGGGLPSPVISKGVQTDPTAQMVEAVRAGRETLTNVFADVNRQAQEFNEMITQTLTNGISNSIADLAFSIGEALATGGNVFKAIGQSLLNSIGNFLGQLGEQLIQVGVAGLAFATLLETIKAGGPAAIPAAIAAIAIGAAMTVAAGAFRGMAGKGLSGGGGGNVSSGGSSQSFGGNGIGMDNSSINLNGEFIVRGTDLVYVLSQEEKKRSKG